MTVLNIIGKCFIGIMIIYFSLFALGLVFEFIITPIKELIKKEKGISREKTLERLSAGIYLIIVFALAAVYTIYFDDDTTSRKMTQDEAMEILVGYSKGYEYSEETLDEARRIIEDYEFEDDSDRDPFIFDPI